MPDARALKSTVGVTQEKFSKYPFVLDYYPFKSREESNAYKNFINFALVYRAKTRGQIFQKELGDDIRIKQIQNINAALAESQNEAQNRFEK